MPLLVSVPFNPSISYPPGSQLVAMNQIGQPPLLILPPPDYSFSPQLGHSSPSDHSSETSIPSSISTQHTQITQGIQNQITRTRKFIPKVAENHSKSNFFISKELMTKMVKQCLEKFVTFQENDEGLAFNYCKQSLAMCIHAEHVYIIKSAKGEVVLFDIDLHFKDGQTMYFVAMENMKEYIEKMKWRIWYIMREEEVFAMFPDLTKTDLPKSSRKMISFQNALNFQPLNVDTDVIENTNVYKLKPIDLKKGSQQKIVAISAKDFLVRCKQTFESNNYVMIPCVIVKASKTWIEWKVPIKINDNDDYMCVGLKWSADKRQWVISCLDYDAGRVYYKHRLVGMPPNDPNNYCNGRYEELKKYCTISLKFT